MKSEGDGNTNPRTWNLNTASGMNALAMEKSSPFHPPRSMVTIGRLLELA